MRARLRRWQTWFLIASLGVLVAGGFQAQLPYFVEAPGRVLTLGGCVRVDSERAVQVRGDYLLTSVSLGRARPFSLLRVAASPAVGLRPADRVVRAETAQEHFAGQRRVFAQTAQRAAALGLRHAGFTADPDRLIGDGALVIGVLEDSPAHGVLRGGDVIVAVDGVPVVTDAEVRAFVEDDPVVVRFNRNGAAQEVTLTPHELVVDGERRAALGLRLETLNLRVDLPVPVHVTSGRMGGPSAGLMIGLAVYDQSDPEIDLAAGRRVAGTGTLASQGVVGRVGGVHLKALAALDQGADVFLVPESQAQEAEAVLPPGAGMRVVPVTTFEGAVRYLEESADIDMRGRDIAPVPCPLGPAT